MKRNTRKEPLTIINKQTGFSFVELMFVLLIISILSFIGAKYGSSFFGEASKKQVIYDTNVAIYSAVAMCSKINIGDLSACSKASLKRKAPTLEDKTACGDTWTITSTSSKTVLIYPLTSCDGKDNIGGEVIEQILKLPGIDTSSAATNYTSPILTITYLNK